MNVDVKVNAGPGNAVTCVINVDGREAEVTFADGEIIFQAPTEAGGITLDIPEELVPVEPPA